MLDGLAIFEFGVICEVFGIDRSADGVPNFDFKVCGPEPGKPLRTSVGATITPDHGLDELVGADLVAIPAISSQYGGFLPAALDAVRKAAESGSIILTVCSGAFVAGAAGLLDGRPCTTHWMHADELAQMYPTAKVDRNVLFVDDGDLITSAGTAAGIDACLHLVRKEQGTRVANGIARRMVVPPHRDGGQAQYVVQPVAPACDGSLQDLLEWLRAHLDQPVTVRQLAARANLSERTFARRFVADTGTTPQRWLIGQRILLAQQLLEESDETVDAIADHTGFGNATALRHHFRLWRGTTPNAYRRLFRGDPSPSAPAAQ